MENGWSVKRLIRRLVLSRAYQLHRVTTTTNFEADPDNVLVWRMTPRRLEAEALRDAMLAVSGELDSTPPTSSPVTPAGEGQSTLLMRQLDQLDSRDLHRTVYLPIVRDSILESLALFDFADPSLVVGERATTDVPAQALYLLNNPFVHPRGRGSGRPAAGRTGNDADRAAARLPVSVLGRPPRPRRRQPSEHFLVAYPRTLVPRGRAPPGGEPRHRWTALCQALFASAEFLNRN